MLLDILNDLFYRNAELLQNRATRSQLSETLCRDSWLHWKMIIKSEIDTAFAFVVKDGQQLISEYLRKVNCAVPKYDIPLDMDHNDLDLDISIFPESFSIEGVWQAIGELFVKPTKDSLAKKGVDGSWRSLHPHIGNEINTIVAFSNAVQMRAERYFKKSINKVRDSIENKIVEIQCKQASIEKNMKEQYRKEKSSIDQICKTLDTLDDLSYLLQNINSCNTTDFLHQLAMFNESFEKLECTANKRRQQRKDKEAAIAERKMMDSISIEVHRFLANYRYPVFGPIAVLLVFGLIGILNIEIQKSLSNLIATPSISYQYCAITCFSLGISVALSWIIASVIRSRCQLMKILTNKYESALIRKTTTEIVSTAKGVSPFKKLFLRKL